MREVLLISDSTLRMGRRSEYQTTEHWCSRWRAHLNYFHTEKFNIMGEGIHWPFSVEVGAKCKDLIQTLKEHVAREGK